jgi:hypothetical protein
VGTLGDVKDLAILGALGVGAYLIFKKKDESTGPGIIGEIAGTLWNPAGIDKSLSETPYIGWTYGLIPKLLTPSEPSPYDAGGGTGGGGGGLR